jgi:Secretion system C-terminal sorting domain
MTTAMVMYACVPALSKSGSLTKISLSVKPAMILYPNPTKGQFKIGVSGIENKLNTHIQVDIENEYGQLVYRNAVKNINGIIYIKMTRQVAAGMYMADCIINGERVSTKIVIGR